MDFIFCELWTEFKPGCSKYYNDDGPRLIDVLSPERIEYFDNEITKAIDIALYLLKTYEEKKWSKRTVVTWKMLKYLMAA